MGGVLRTTQRSESENNFFKKFENNSGSLVEFWMRFESAIDQQRHTQKKLDNDNRQSSPKLITQLPIEIHGSRMYTHEMFEDFQQEVISSTSGLSARGFSEKDGFEITTLKDGLQGKFYDIHFNLGTFEVNCTCMMFERAGLLCRHIISIFSSNGVSSIPDCYLAKSLLREFRLNLEPECPDLTKEQEIEQLLGCKAVDEISILPPKHAKNKGSGRRMLSNKTVDVAKALKPKRMCSNYKQMSHHDKRTCPNNFAEFSPLVPISSSDEAGFDEVMEEEDVSE
ncbi:hypothetical protein RND81_08G090300 [Saponaria officinalis]|uniref:Protein FAR1-RELATED SEQUENCE n=1 Tax=Saponaria officinalis TaxID=3572 RepID=A0AAW1J5K9_SAPOF